MNKPTCKVNGMIQPGAMCGSVIVGLKYCGFTGDCQHKSCAEMIVEKVKADAEQRRAAADDVPDQAGGAA